MRDHKRKAGMRRRGRAIAIAASTALVASASVFGSAAPALADIDSSSYAAVANAYTTRYAPAMSDTVGWTGDVDGCVPGTTSSQSQQLSLNAINFDRDLVGLDPITLDTALSAKAQSAALVMSANNALSHDVPTNWDCYTTTAHDAAAASNLYLGGAGAKAIDGYMVDPGASNHAVGHRRWILYAPRTTMGTGSTTNSNALYVFGKLASSGYANPSWVPWPAAGFFPTQLEPQGKWSLTGAAGRSYDFSKATVRVTSSSGHALTVHRYKSVRGYGSDTLVWWVTGLHHPSVTGTSVHYRVTVKGIVVGGKKVTKSYVVKLIKPPTS